MIVCLWLVSCTIAAARGVSGRPRGFLLLRWLVGQQHGLWPAAVQILTSAGGVSFLDVLCCEKRCSVRSTTNTQNRRSTNYPTINHKAKQATQGGRFEGGADDDTVWLNLLYSSCSTKHVCGRGVGGPLVAWRGEDEEMDVGGTHCGW